MFYEDLPTRPSRTNTKKRCPFHHRGLERKSRKSRDTCSNGQGWPWSTEWRGQRLVEFCQEKALVTANTLFQQHKRRMYTRTSPDGQHRNQIWLDSLQPKMEKLYIVSKNKARGWLWFRSWTPYCKITDMKLEIRKWGDCYRTPWLNWSL